MRSGSAVYPCNNLATQAAAVFKAGANTAAAAAVTLTKQVAAHSQQMVQ